MTRDDIIGMALEAGAEFYARTICVNGKDIDDFIVRFAAIVAAAEREECAKVAECEVTMEGYEKEIAIAIRARGQQ